MGGAGFVGSHLCEQLLADGAESVLAIDNLVTGSARNVAELSRAKGFSFRQHDVVEPFRVDGPVDFVFNLASPASPVDFQRIPIEIMRVGSIGTENGLKLAEEKKAVFLQASTSEIYGDPLVHPQREDYFGNVNTLGPRAVYDEGKRYAEALVMAYHRARGVQTRIVRIFNTYGPRMRLDDGRVVPAFVSQALRKQPYTVFGDGKQTRSFCYVKDLVEGVIKLVCSDVIDPVNIGNPREMTILQFLDAVRGATQSKGEVVFKESMQNDPKQRQPDITRARTLLQWEPKTSLEEGLVQTVRYFESVAAAG